MARNLSMDFDIEDAEAFRSTTGCPALERHGCGKCRLCKSDYCFGDRLLDIRMGTEALERNLEEPGLTEEEKAATARQLCDLDMRALQLKAFAKVHPEVCERRPGYTRKHLAKLMDEVF